MNFKAEDIQGRHVVIAGLILYFVSFCIGAASTGMALEDSDKNIHDSNYDESLSGTKEMNIAYRPGMLNTSEVSEMAVPAMYLKRIFLNNLGLNAIIILGAFSLLAFSMIVLIFNALHVGILIKGIYSSYGLRLAAALVMPHLVVEVISHILSLYIAFLILQRVIVPVLRGEGIEIHSFKYVKILVLFFLVLLITFVGALIEIYVTPKLI